MADREKIDLGLLEEDDEFEEFPAEHWGAEDADGEGDVSVWEDNWEDDVVQDDFHQQLKKQQDKLKEQAATATATTTATDTATTPTPMNQQ